MDTLSHFTLAFSLSPVDLMACEIGDCGDCQDLTDFALVLSDSCGLTVTKLGDHGVLHLLSAISPEQTTTIRD